MVVVYRVLHAVLLAAAVPLSQGGGLVRREAKKGSISELQMAIKEVLQEDPAGRLLSVEESVRPSYEAFPKNVEGHIPAEEFFPAIVRNYFAKEHGWLIKGLEPPSFQQGPLRIESLKIFTDRAPVVGAALGKIRESGEGLALSDLVGVIAVVEHLLLEESTQVLQDAYFLNGQSTEVAIDEQTLTKLLQSYLILFRRGRHYNRTDVASHERLVSRAKNSSDWPSMSTFVETTMQSSDLSGKKITFEVAKEALLKMANQYGKWQNEECVEMKDFLVGMSPDRASGHLPFETFHNEPPHPHFQFTESEDYLRKLGVLDESGSGHEVRIANYLMGPTNCIAPSGYFAVCCLSECEALISELEAKAQTAALGADELADIVRNTPTSTVQVPRELSAALGDELLEIAGRHDGLVPLHSGDFKRWLHFAYPNECAMPTSHEMAAEDSEEKEANAWLEQQHVCTRVPEWHTDRGTVIEF